jgi:pyruvate dehydrogenase E1 component
LNGEGLQHQDGQSHHLAYPVTTLLTYDPAFAFELAIIIREGIRRMYEEQEDLFYYITVMNENYAMPPMPEGVKEGIVKGLYKFKTSEKKKLQLKVNLLGSGTIMNEVLKAQEILEERYDVAADIYSATSYKELRREALDIERWNLLNPGDQKETYIAKVFQNTSGVFVASSDYIKSIPDSISKWIPGRLITLGTDGFGRSEGRKELRDFFEVDARYVVVASLYGLMLEGKVKQTVVDKAIEELDIDKNKLNPMIS